MRRSARRAGDGRAVQRRVTLRIELVHVGTAFDQERDPRKITGSTALDSS